MSQGRRNQVTLPTPPLEYSMQPGEPQPYAEYTIQVTARGYHPVNVSGINVFADETAIQEVELEPTGEIEEEQENIVIPANTLFGDYPPKIAEAEVKPVAETGEIVLNRVVIPEYVIVHDGAPTVLQQRIIMYVTEIILKTLHPVKFIPHGRTQHCGRIF